MHKMTELEFLESVRSRWNDEGLKDWQSLVGDNFPATHLIDEGNEVVPVVARKVGTDTFFYPRSTVRGDDPAIYWQWRDNKDLRYFGTDVSDLFESSSVIKLPTQEEIDAEERAEKARKTLIYCHDRESLLERFGWLLPTTGTESPDTLFRDWSQTIDDNMISDWWDASNKMMEECRWIADADYEYERSFAKYHTGRGCLSAPVHVQEDAPESVKEFARLLESDLETRIRIDQDQWLRLQKDAEGEGE